jgi:selenocysteine lyase/cysteine desulfurase
MAEIMHRHGGWCFIDYAAAAPYAAIDMHPAKARQKLDAIFISPHKFLGGPGSSGVMIMDRALYTNKVPDQLGGGTVLWTNPWGEQRYFDNIEVREDGGTPGFLQAVKGALAVRLKEEMDSKAMMEKEETLKDALMEKLASIPGLQMLEGHIRKRLGIVSFYSLEKHHNLIVQLLNDRFGVQSRGGCDCAGTYGHILLNVGREQSRRIAEKIDQGDLSEKPGWVRLSLHPVMTLEEVEAIAEAVRQVLSHYEEWSRDYAFDPQTAEFRLGAYSPEKIDLGRDFSPLDK